MARSLLTAEEKKKYFVKFNVDGLLRGDYQSRMNGYAVGRQNGWMSANDIRELENLDRIPEDLGGDLYLVNGNMMKLEDAGLGYGVGSPAGGTEDGGGPAVREGRQRNPGAGAVGDAEKADGPGSSPGKGRTAGEGSGHPGKRAGGKPADGGG